MMGRQGGREGAVASWWWTAGAGSELPVRVVPGPLLTPWLHQWLAAMGLPINYGLCHVE